MRNRLSDLDNILFEQIERVNDDSLSAEEQEKANAKAKTVAVLASQLVQNAKIELDVVKLQMEYGKNIGSLPAMLTYDDQ